MDCGLSGAHGTFVTATCVKPTRQFDECENVWHPNLADRLFAKEDPRSRGRHVMRLRAFKVGHEFFATDGNIPY